MARRHYESRKANRSFGKSAMKTKSANTKVFRGGIRL